MTREEALNKAINIVRYFEANFAKSKEARENAAKIIEALEQEPCDDVISRHAVLKEFEDDQYSLDYCMNAAINEWRGELNQAIEKALEKQSGWIPVSERLPEDRREVLVTAYWHETYQVMMASYYGDGLWWCVPFNNCGEHMQRLKPKAWMPLPEPYRAESEEA